MKKFLSIVAIAVSLLVFGSCKKTENAGQNRSVVYFNDIQINDPVCEGMYAPFPPRVQHAPRLLQLFITYAPELRVKSGFGMNELFIAIPRDSLGKTVNILPSRAPSLPSTTCYAYFEDTPLVGKFTVNQAEDNEIRFIIDFDFDLEAWVSPDEGEPEERIIKLKGHVDKMFLERPSRPYNPGGPM